MILGPTAVGKTSLAVELARRLPAEIVSADSRLVYRGMDIGTAKPTPEERQIVPHHLIDVVDAAADFSVRRYQKLAQDAIDDIHARKKLVLLVGGTGQYLRALLEGWQPPPRATDSSIRARLRSQAEEHGRESLHTRLRELDPERAAEIHPNNLRRVIRALEVYELTGKPPSKVHDKAPPDYEVLRLGLTIEDRALEDRIRARLEQMIADGLLDEVRSLLEGGLRPEGSAMSAIGYRQIAAYLAGEGTLEEAKREIIADTLEFVRRQYTWFKPDDPMIRWLTAGESVVDRAEELIRDWLASGEDGAGTGRQAV